MCLPVLLTKLNCQINTFVTSGSPASIRLNLSLLVGSLVREVGRGGGGAGTKRIQTSRREGNKGSEGKSEPARKKARDRGAGGVGGTRAL